MNVEFRAPGSTRSGRPGARQGIRSGALVLLVGLLVQFLAGMLVNLFVQIPDHHPGSQPSEYFAGSFQSVLWAITGSGTPTLIFHAAWGLLLVLRSLAMVVEARSMRRRAITVAAVLGFLLILGAGFNGASFLDFGEDFSSMIMATLFALATLCYATILFLLAGEG